MKNTQVEMPMNRKWIAFVLMPMLMLVLWGCPKKEPATPEPDLEVVSEPVEEEVEVEPEIEEPAEDIVESDLPSDIMELNEVVRQRGLIDDVYFEFDQSDLSEQARQRLADNAEFMREYPEYVFRIEGHADERGTNDYNLALGNRRASSAADYLASLNIDPSRLETLSYGEERPFCTDSTESCWQRNRRAHFVITGRR